MKRYLYYFVTLIFVFAITDLFLDGELLGLGSQDSEEISARTSVVNNVESQLTEERETEKDDAEELGKLIASKSCEFVRAAFDRDKVKIAGMLSKDAEYMLSEDKASYIRYTTEDLHVEGYMATDRRLVQVRQSWYVIQDDGTITSEVEVLIAGDETPQTWYIHYRKSLGQWKIFMLENGI